MAFPVSHNQHTSSDQVHMPKAEVGSAKWVSSQIRKSGKTKIRWYCGLCKVACKDENGYKCHLQSDSHIHRELAVTESLRTFKVSREDKTFKRRFVNCLISKYFGQTVLAHDVYRDLFPLDRAHAVMKQTCWATLGVFMAQLRKEGLVEAQKGLKGWQVRVSDDAVLASDESDSSADEKPNITASTSPRDNGSSVNVSKLEELRLNKIVKSFPPEAYSESTTRVDSSAKVTFSFDQKLGVKSNNKINPNIFQTNSSSDDESSINS